MARLDFGRVNRRSAVDSATEPRRIFAALPQKDPKYNYARDVQTEVWERWHERRDETDLVIKMNTGGGKTVVGLVVLKSCLNEGHGPAVYVTPDKYLASQVRREAANIRIEVVDDPNSSRFQAGKAILVTHIHKLVNGRSVFGVQGDARQHIPLGTVLIDDAHACLAIVEEQFTLQIPRSHPAYNHLIDLFVDDLRAQSPSAVRDLHEDVPGVALRIPYWAWADRQEKVLNVLHPHRGGEGFLFSWPLIHECLAHSDAAVSYNEIEIKPPCPAIDRIPSLASASRRLYLTATLADDSVVVTHFDADPESVARPITPRSADDLGDRMILTPLETHPGTSDDELQEFLARQARRHNVVIIVPSVRRANAWSSVATAVHQSTTIHQGIEDLRSRHVGLVVLVNKYDGIDLPGDACRILVLDGLPEAYGALDRLEALALAESDAMLMRQVQRIEQGMGRGVRSNDDYCVVLLLGSRLTQRIHHAGGARRFSPATRAQLQLSDEIADMLHKRPFADLAEVIEQCLGRDQGWVTASRDALDGVTYENHDLLSESAVAERKSFGLAELGRYAEASDWLQRSINTTPDVRLRGWLKQRAAAYMHHVDPAQSLNLQKSAQTDNRAVLRPRDGVEYRRLSTITDQARCAGDYMSGLYSSGNELVIGIAAILEDLKPNYDDPAAPNCFEQAMHDLGLHLGFAAQRPELEVGNGPDVLWSLGDLRYLVIECKSGAVTDFIPRHDVGQLSQAMTWFEGKYDNTCKPVPVMIHKVSLLHSKAHAMSGMRVVSFDQLARLRDSVRRYIAALSCDNEYKDPKAVAKHLATWHFGGKELINHWGLVTRKQQ